ncbi:hypothetical protein AB0M44_30970 [Streptosporangium subroseum]|uniref:hypothetical protein n=1 Tax=Streptosporangium subroseum TaxID=106412 RepID=UPI0034490690
MGLAPGPAELEPGSVWRFLAAGPVVEDHAAELWAALSGAPRAVPVVALAVELVAVDHAVGDWAAPEEAPRAALAAAPAAVAGELLAVAGSLAQPTTLAARSAPLAVQLELVDVVPPRTLPGPVPAPASWMRPRTISRAGEPAVSATVPGALVARSVRPGAAELRTSGASLASWTARPASGSPRRGPRPWPAAGAAR